MTIKTRYVCDVCKGEYVRQESAELCEKHPPIIAKFKVGDLVVPKPNHRKITPSKIIAVRVINSGLYEFVEGDKDIQMDPGSEASFNTKYYVHMIVYEIPKLFDELRDVGVKHDSFQYFIEDEIVLAKT